MSVQWSSLEEYNYSGESARLCCVGYTDQSQRFLGAHVLLTLLYTSAPFPKLVALELARLYPLLPRFLERESFSSLTGATQIPADVGEGTPPWRCHFSQVKPADARQSSGLSDSAHLGPIFLFLRLKNVRIRTELPQTTRGSHPQAYHDVMACGWTLSLPWLRPCEIVAETWRRPVGLKVAQEG